MVITFNNNLLVLHYNYVILKVIHFHLITDFNKLLYSQVNSVVGIDKLS